MADRASTDKTIIDPRFVIPEGAEEIFAYSKELTEEDYADADFLDFEDGAIDDYLDYTDDGSDDDEQNILDVPTGLVIINQVLRRAPGGQATVDVVIQVDDVPGATNYEIQVTKA